MPFWRKKNDKSTASTAPTLAISMDTARPAIEALVASCGADANNDQVRTAIDNFVRLSGKPTDLMALADAKFNGDHDIVHRPWQWLAQAMAQASSEGDNVTAVGGMYWAFHWTTNMLPRIGPGDQVELGLDPIPAGLRSEIRNIGEQACERLPADTVIARDSTGELQVGIAQQLAGQL